jgi:hypothetical protein
MRSHTGGVISFGNGGLMCKSSKQKLNTKSSTEAELIGASDYLPNTIWLKYFLEAQGYAVESNYLEQDNESAIRLEKNGKASAGQRSRHINIRYFFIKDRVRTEGIEIRHCPTLQMLADFFTKPLQGNLFRKFRDVVLGYKNINALTLTTPIPTEERVGDRAETDAMSARRKCDEEDTKSDVANHVETTSAVNHEYAKGKNSSDERWITVIGKRKVARFQDMSDVVIAH